MLLLLLLLLVVVVVVGGGGDVTSTTSDENTASMKKVAKAFSSVGLSSCSGYWGLQSPESCVVLKKRQEEEEKPKSGVRTNARNKTEDTEAYLVGHDMGVCVCVIL